MSKRGVKSDYIKIGSAANPTELQDAVNGHILGISQNKHNKNYYTMIPKALLPKGAKRSKQKWLGSDLEIAIAKFNALISKIKGEKEKGIEIKSLPVFEIKKDGNIKKNLKVDQIDEKIFIQWLRKEIQNPKKLAKKTGIAELAELGTILAKDTNIPLSELLTNYLNKKKRISPKEAKDSTKWFNSFCKVINSKTVDSITLQDIHKYEDFIHSQNLAPKIIIHRINKISTIFKYNCGRFNSTHLIQIHNWLKGIDRPEEDKAYNPSLISLGDFNKLMEVSNLKWKLMLLLGLNCAMYPIDISRLLKSNINFKQGTTAFRRGKTGKVLAVSTLWSRTINALQAYLDSRKDNSEYLFLTSRGSNYSGSGSVTDYFNKFIKSKTTVDGSVTFSQLRDTFSTLAQDLGYSIEQINLVLGHKNKGMNDRYAVRQANKLTKEMCLNVEKEFFGQNEE